MKQKQSVTLN